MVLLWLILGMGVLSFGYQGDSYRARAVGEFLEQLEDEISRNTSDRIVGGLQAFPGQFPFIASLKRFNYGQYFHFCGGSALSTSYIITAAHCVDDKTAQSIFVSMGDHDKSFKEGSEEMIQADRIFMHWGFDPSNLKNDTAIIRLSRPFSLSNRRQNIKLMPDENKLQNRYYQNKRTDLTVAGWGSLRMNGPSPKILNYVTIPYIDNNTCRRVMSSYSIFSGNLCAGDPKYGQKDACQGDSGGPIVFRGNSGWELAGLVSWGVGCAKPGYAGIYTNVAHYRSWIFDTINNRF